MDPFSRPGAPLERSGWDEEATIFDLRMTTDDGTLCWIEFVLAMNSRTV